MTRSAARQPLDIRIARDYAAMSEQAAEAIGGEIKRIPNLLLCASAGGTPTKTYASLAVHAGRLPRVFSKLRVIQIDEWGGLPRGHAATCKRDLQLNLLSPLKVGADRFVEFHSDAAEP